MILNRRCVIIDVFFVMTAIITIPIYCHLLEICSVDRTFPASSTHS
jgi:hypothetical protein